MHETCKQQTFKSIRYLAYRIENITMMTSNKLSIHDSFHFSICFQSADLHDQYMVIYKDNIQLCPYMCKLG